MDLTVEVMEYVVLTLMSLINVLSTIHYQRCMTLWHYLRALDEADVFLLSLWTAPLPPPKSKSQWMRIRSKHWWETVVLTEFTDQEWKANFRMCRRSFMKLCTVMSPYMSPEATTVRAPIPLVMRVAIVLYKLGSCAEYRVGANQFGVHKCTVKKFVYQFCISMMEGPVRQLIHVPTDHEALEIARRFKAAYHIPQVMGLIDGTHIPILPPSDGYRDFVNRKGWPSYVLQGVVDDRCCFWSQSDLYKRAHLLPKCVKTVEGQDIPLFLIGDPAYPLLNWLIKGYKNSPRLSPEQESFNTYLCSARVGIENTFGMLKARWRVLLKRSEFHFTFAPKVIATCCALHNFCQREKDAPHSNWLEEAIDPSVSYPQPNKLDNCRDNTGGSSAREALTTYMATHFAQGICINKVVNSS